MFTRPLIFATAFMSFFSVVIALFKVNKDGKRLNLCILKVKHSTVIDEKFSFLVGCRIYLISKGIRYSESDHSL